MLHFFLLNSAWSQSLPETATTIEQGEQAKRELKNSLETLSTPEGEKMKKNWISTWSFIGLFAIGATGVEDANAQLKRNGGRGPGGGDVLLCEKDAANRFNGQYSYDYIQTRNSLKEENSDEFNFPKEDSCQVRMKRIAAKLENVNPVMAAGLRDFIKSVPFKGGETSTARRRWIPSGDSKNAECHSYDIKDETHLVKADNCKTCQLFNRDYSRTRPQVLYSYNAGLFKNIQKSPTQCSYALVHEWARDFLPDSKDLYFFTASLHSEKFMNKGELSLLPLDQATETCFEMSKHSPMGTDKLDIYFDISALVPPTQDEVERYQNEMVRMTAELDKEIDRHIHSLRESRPIGFNERQVEYIAKKAQNEKIALMSDLDAKAISHAEAYDQLKLIQSTLPNYKPFELDFGMMILNDVGPVSTFRPPRDDEMPAKFEMIKTRPVKP